MINFEEQKSKFSLFCMFLIKLEHSEKIFRNFVLNFFGKILLFIYIIHNKFNLLRHVVRL